MLSSEVLTVEKDDAITIDKLSLLIKRMKSQTLISSDLAGIQYVGLSGITSSCVKAITRLVSEAVSIKTAYLITHKSNHAFFLDDDYDGMIAVKAGFRSGYSGEGPRGLATALVILNRHNIEIEEREVESSLALFFCFFYTLTK